MSGLCSSINCSLQYLLMNTKKGSGKNPLLECKMELQAPLVLFIPDVDQVCMSIKDITLIRYNRYNPYKNIYYNVEDGNHRSTVSVFLRLGLWLN